LHSSVISVIFFIAVCPFFACFSHLGRQFSDFSLFDSPKKYKLPAKHLTKSDISVTVYVSVCLGSWQEIVFFRHNYFGLG